MARAGPFLRRLKIKNKGNHLLSSTKSVGNYSRKPKTVAQWRRAAPLKNIHSVTIKSQVLSFNKTSMTECRALNERFSLKVVTSLVPTKLHLLETLFGTPLWGKEGLKRQPMSHIKKQASIMFGRLKTEYPRSKDDIEKMKSVL